MSDLESKPVTGDAKNWEAECVALRNQVSLLFLCLFICSGTLSVFLWKQNRIAATQFENSHRKFEPRLKDYKSKQKDFEVFEQKITEWARTHADFNRFLSAHNIQLLPAPGPAPAAAPKK